MEELIEILDERGSFLGKKPRSEVHRRGLWHRASNVFLFRSNGDLLVQRRQYDKDVCPGVWDLSAAEHLQPGENFEQGAIRGLLEELSVEGVKLELFGDVTKTRLEIPESHIKDYEFQQSFCAIYDGPVFPDPVEVHEVSTVNLKELGKKFLDEPESYTPWFRERATELKLV